MRSSVSLAVARSHAGSAATADQAAVVAVVAGDTARFGELYSRHYAPVRNYARSMLGDEAEAEDIAQETFILALRALPRYEDRGLPFRAWLIRIAHNTAPGHLRRHSRILALPPLERPTPSSVGARAIPRASPTRWFHRLNAYANAALDDPRGAVALVQRAFVRALAEAPSYDFAAQPWLQPN